MKSKSSKKGLLTLLLYLLLMGACSTYVMPTIQVHLPPLVNERWSPWDMTKSLPKALTQKKTPWARLKLDHDFADVLLRLIPQDPNQDPKKLSGPFIFGILIPICLAATYLIIIFGFLLVYAERYGTMKFLSGLGVLTSVYALAGTYYLAQEAGKIFRASVAQASEKFLGALTKNFVQHITLEADYGLYLLFLLMLLIYTVQTIRKG